MACGPRPKSAARRLDPDSDRVPVRHEEGEGPDRCAPPVGGREERKGVGGRVGPGKGSGPAGGEVWAGGKKKK